MLRDHERAAEAVGELCGGCSVGIAGVGVDERRARRSVGRHPVGEGSLAPRRDGAPPTSCRWPTWCRPQSRGARSGPARRPRTRSGGRAGCSLARPRPWPNERAPPGGRVRSPRRSVAGDRTKRRAGRPAWSRRAQPPGPRRTARPPRSSTPGYQLATTRTSSGSGREPGSTAELMPRARSRPGGRPRRAVGPSGRQPFVGQAPEAARCHRRPARANRPDRGDMVVPVDRDDLDGPVRGETAGDRLDGECCRSERSGRSRIPAQDPPDGAGGVVDESAQTSRRCPAAGSPRARPGPRASANRYRPRSGERRTAARLSPGSLL